MDSYKITYKFGFKIIKRNKKSKSRENLQILFQEKVSTSIIDSIKIISNHHYIWLLEAKNVKGNSISGVRI
jgi:uncharacterized protein YebE (UPF0316 family)